VSHSCDTPYTFILDISDSAACTLFWGWIRAEEESFLFLGELLQLILESQKLLRFSPLQSASDTCYHINLS